eukprot:CAMPEP_0198292668 /NCGR_PEP_ID=MMETSP1449-20131203/13242_1 /TAXON_ID=420275 /ORGANISM="Attheya septentrionalis, Strain CCMP2084" /LENGTH=542 /DNA_ID=CAMNT_0043991885 /DNA_START=145 /DNA_END=1773 /DNA_ORIENTATION=-
MQQQPRQTPVGDNSQMNLVPEQKYRTTIPTREQFHEKQSSVVGRVHGEASFKANPHGTFALQQKSHGGAYHGEEETSKSVVSQSFASPPEMNHGSSRSISGSQYDHQRVLKSPADHYDAHTHQNIPSSRQHSPNESYHGSAAQTHPPVPTPYFDLAAPPYPYMGGRPGWPHSHPAHPDQSPDVKSHSTVHPSEIARPPHHHGRTELPYFISSHYHPTPPTPITTGSSTVYPNNAPHQVTYVYYPGIGYQQHYSSPSSYIQQAPPSHFQNLTYVHELNPADVLCGRGGATNCYPGNMAFRKLVKEHKGRYLLAKKKDKPSVAAFVVDFIREKGGRFLSKDRESATWIDIGDARAKEKTSQALREGAPEMRRKKKAKTRKTGDDDASSRSSSYGTSRGSSNMDVSDDEKQVKHSPPNRSKTGEDTIADEEGMSDSKPSNVITLTLSYTSSYDEDAEVNDVAAEQNSDVDERRDEDETSSNKKEEHFIKPALALTRRKFKNITLDSLSSQERAAYLHDFLPPPSNLRSKPQRKGTSRLAEIRCKE